MTLPSQRDGVRVPETYPAPTIVVGVGEMGLAVLERLGEDWSTLSQTGPDASLRNLRLLHVRPDANGQGDWRQHERQAVKIARYVGESDLPSLAVDFTILRALGLIRYRDGCYQVALPKDEGVVDLDAKSDLPVAPSGGKSESGGVCREVRRAKPARRRYFEWLSLSPDPVIAVERLYRLAERFTDLDVFITPILTRVRQGHSPRVLLASIGRCQALADGRDPSPWDWVRKLAESSAGELSLSIGDEEEARAKLGLKPNELDKQPQRRFLESFAVPPVAEWSDWLKYVTGDRAVKPVGAEPPSLKIHIPQIFMPRDNEIELKIDPIEFLKVDWEATGWATGVLSGSDAVRFTPVPASPFRLGLFDHDGTRLGWLGADEPLKRRLRVLAALTWRGLVRLWVDLQRDRVEEGEAQLYQARRRKRADEALSQSLEVLGELLVRPLLAEDDSAISTESLPPVPASRSSYFLAGLTVERPRRGNAVEQQLGDRLTALGLEKAGPDEDLSHKLLREVALAPETVLKDEDSKVRGSAESLVAPPDITRLRKVLNEQVRELYRLSHLSRYRQQLSRRLPRLTVYVVADMAEAFSRACYRTLLREIHAELLRAFGPIFEHNREGFDRALSVVPILWMPHPADPFEGEAQQHQQQRQLEEAAIIDAVQGIRRWVESVIPATRRRISQIFVNSRVTEAAVLSQRDVICQTRDFITFQCRNDLRDDVWLRSTAVGSPGEDIFSSFACYEIEFPAEKAREYLANRLARRLLATLQGGRVEEVPSPDAEDSRPAAIQELLKGAGPRVEGSTAAAAEQLVTRVESRATFDRRTSALELVRKFDESFEQQLKEQIQHVWERLTQRRGDMDDLVDGLRRRSAEALSDALSKVRKYGDELVERVAEDLGILAAHAGFLELRAMARDTLESQEQQRLDQERLTMRHRVPDLGPLESARREVAEVAGKKPDNGPLLLGLVIWVLLAPVLGGPLCHAVAYALDLHEEPNLAELLLGPYGLLTGGLLLAFGGWLFLDRVMKRSLRKIRGAINRLERSVREIVEGTGLAPKSEPRASVRSFLETRLLLSAALTNRGFALRVFERVAADNAQVERLGNSVKTQIHLLWRRSEHLGVRPRMDTEAEGLGVAFDVEEVNKTEDVSRLFASRSGEALETLITASSLADFFDRRQELASEMERLMPGLFEATGGFAGWRRSAPFADTERILGFTRGQFADIVEKPVSDQPVFADEAGRRLVDFVARIYPNMGLGADFAGSEGLDPDGVRVLADTALVLPRELSSVYDRTRRELEASRRDPETGALRRVDVREASLRPNAAYMLSMAQDIRPHAVRNLKRFESFHDRPFMPDDRTFPMSGDEHHGSINHMTVYQPMANELRRSLREAEKAPDEGPNDDPSETSSPT